MSSQAQRDARTAARRTSREAARYPLLARLGLTRTWTGEEVAQQRLDVREAGALREEQSEGRARASAQLFRAACAEVVSADVLAEMDRYVARTYPAGLHYVAGFWRHAAARLGLGGPAFEPAQVFAAPTPRVPCDPKAVLGVLRASSQPITVGRILDALAHPGTVLDVTDALAHLRTQGLARVARVGWVAVATDGAVP